VNIRAILDHGDFGLGTFTDLDGEMVVLEGQVYQANSEGDPTVALGGAVATSESLKKLRQTMDAVRRSCYTRLVIGAGRTPLLRYCAYWTTRSSKVFGVPWVIKLATG
jgi:Alpha-acetolactate decarboxylase